MGHTAHIMAALHMGIVFVWRNLLNHCIAHYHYHYHAEPKVPDNDRPRRDDSAYEEDDFLLGMVLVLVLVLFACITITHHTSYPFLVLTCIMLCTLCTSTTTSFRPLCAPLTTRCRRAMAIIRRTTSREEALCLPRARRPASCCRAYCGRFCYM
jgi:hypothetical protein